MQINIGTNFKLFMCQTDTSSPIFSLYADLDSTNILAIYQDI